VNVLFVGEGSNDIGCADYSPNQPRSAGGVVPTLARKLCPLIGDSLAIRWTEITRFSKGKVRRGFAAKVAAAMLLSQAHGCSGTICVLDCDGCPERLDELQEGKERGAAALGGTHPTACGIAVESIEAWTLGDRQAIAQELAVSEPDVSGLYPRGKKVEELRESSKQENYRPKALLKRIAQLGHREDSTAFRQAIAERTDIARLEHFCPRGFEPFAEEVRREFGSAAEQKSQTPEIE
jgi:hypothetical protein